MIEIRRDVYVDPATPDEARDRLRHGVDVARGVARAVFGEVRAAPAVICSTDDCRRFFAGPAMRSWTLAPHDRVPGAAYVAGAQPTIVIVRTDEVAERQLVHEWIHQEMAARLARYGDLPAWFHEGIAATIGDEPRCPPGLPDGIDDLRRLDRNAAWAAYTNQAEHLVPTYCQARREIAVWAEGKLGERLRALIDAVEHGEAFERAYER